MEEAPFYLVEMSEPAEMEVEAISLKLMQFGLQVSDRWYAGFVRSIERLALFPYGFAIAPETEAMRGEVRQMLYGKGSNIYRILYRVIQPLEGENGIVRIMHIRHVAQSPFNQQDTDG